MHIFYGKYMRTRKINNNRLRRSRRINKFFIKHKTYLIVNLGE